MDLLLSTARQILLYRALGSTLIPAFYHCPLVRDTEGKRLAKRSPGVTISNLREKGYTPDRIMQEYFGTDVLANLKS
jgi:glutamyl-tRNA synthetase